MESSLTPPSAANRVGLVSLLAAATGFVALAGLQAAGVLINPWWAVPTIAFEAALVGAVADWYAVTVLFHKAWWPLRWLPPFSRHQEIIIQKRARITADIADMVQNHWLSPAAIEAKLKEQSFARHLLAYHAAPGNRGQLVRLVGNTLQVLAPGLAAPELAQVLEGVVRDQLRAAPLGQPFGRWLKAAVAQGEQARVWEALLASLDSGLRDRETRALIARLVEAAADAYAAEDLFKELAVGAARVFGALDPAAAADAIVAKAAAMVNEARHNPQHPLRRKVDAWLLDWAAKLEAGEPATLAAFASVQQRIAGHAELRELIAGLLANLRQSLDAQLAAPDSPLLAVLEKVIAGGMARLEGDPALQQRVDEFVRSRIVEWIGRNRDEIGDTVRRSVGKLDDRELVAMLEAKVGGELQWIRLNGAVMGGMIGLFIGLARQAMLLWS